MSVPARLLAFTALLAIVFGLAALAGRAAGPAIDPAPPAMSQQHGAVVIDGAPAAAQLRAATTHAQEITR